MFAALIVLQVQLLFVYRAWMRKHFRYLAFGYFLTSLTVSNKSKILVGCVLMLPVAQFTADMVYFSRTYHLTSFTEFKGTLTMARVAASIVVVTEAVLAMTLVVLHQRRLADLSRMNSVVDRVASTIRTGLFTEAWAYIIGTGLITAVWTLLGLLLDAGIPNTFILMMMLELLPKSECLAVTAW